MVTKAMLGRFSNNPKVLDQLSEATIPRQPFRGNFDIWTKGRPLKHPILNDRLRRQPSGSVP